MAIADQRRQLDRIDLLRNFAEKVDRERFDLEPDSCDAERAAMRANVDQLIAALGRLRARLGEATAVCARCGRTFVPVRAEAKYCKPACRQAARRLRDRS